MSDGIARRLRALETIWQRPDAGALTVRRIAEEVAAEFGLPVEDVLAEAEAIAARPPRTVEDVADAVANELGLPRELVRSEARTLWAEALRVRQ